MVALRIKFYSMICLSYFSPYSLYS